MLIPNKYNGYQAGIRIYPVGGGVGEAMLLGAAMGGGSAAITGGDPLKGALLGAATGGAGAGISGALGGATAGTEAALATAGTEAATQAGTQAATQAATQGATNYALGAPAGGLGINPATANVGLSPTMAQTGMQSANYALGSPTLASNYALGAPTVAPGAGISGLPAASAAPTTGGTFTEGMARFAQNPMASIKANQFTAGASALAGAVGARPDFNPPSDDYEGPLKRFRFNPDTYRPSLYADGGIATLTSGGYDRMVGEEPQYPENMASGGISSLGSYSDGGRMLKGPGDGMSDSIPASIGNKRPARLADGEFVVPADVVSHLGNGSTDAGAKQLYAMMDKVRTARTGRKAQGREINPRKYMPA